jgi:phospholipid transport system substrate-binding protein
VGLAAWAWAGLASARPTAPTSGSASDGVGRAGRSSLVAPPSPGDPLEELRRTDVTLEAVVRRRFPEWSPEADVARMRVQSILAGILDYERIARGALGPDWGRLDDAQRRAFLGRFSALTNQAFIGALTRWDARVRFDSETIFGPTASVLVTASEGGGGARPSERIEYRLGLKGTRWLVFDVLVDGVSLVEGYRIQFASLMRRGGFEEIMARMQRKLDESSR